MCRTVGVEPGEAPQTSFLKSNRQEIREDLEYTKEDIAHVEEWVKVSSPDPDEVVVARY